MCHLDPAGSEIPKQSYALRLNNHATPFIFCHLRFAMCVARSRMTVEFLGNDGC